MRPELSMPRPRTSAPAVIMGGVQFKGQPLYRVWEHDRTVLRFFSREVEQMPRGSWRVKGYFTVLEVKIDQNHGIDHVVKQVRQAEEAVLKLNGISHDP